MSYMIGSLVGGLILIYLLSKVWEWALFKRVMDEPTSGKLASVVAAWATAGTIGGFGMADGGPYAWWAFAIYLLPALFVGVFAYRAGAKLSVEQDNPGGYRP